MIANMITRITLLMQFQFFGLEFATFVWVFTIYNFIGWFYESTIFSLGEQGKFMNRGYFIGPYCPIYGGGFFLNYFILYGVTSVWKIFLISALTCTVIEYVVSYVLEKRFHTRYWDYHYYPLNINGRVSVPSSTFFGLMITFMMKIVTPGVLRIVERIPKRALYSTAVVLIFLLILDCILTYICMANLNKKCREVYDRWDEYVDGKLEILNERKDRLDKYVVVQKGKSLMVKAKSINHLCVEMEPLVKAKIRYALHELLGIK